MSKSFVLNIGNWYHPNVFISSNIFLLLFSLEDSIVLQLYYFYTFSNKQKRDKKNSEWT